MAGEEGGRGGGKVEMVDRGEGGVGVGWKRGERMGGWGRRGNGRGDVREERGGLGGEGRGRGWDRGEGADT